MNRCKTCKYWDRYTEISDVKFYGGHYGSCANNKFVYESNPKNPIDGLCYWDSEGWAAGFNTGENFGCVNWQEK